MTESQELRSQITSYGQWGLIPFFSIAGIVWVLPDTTSLSIAYYFLTYSSVILSFLGGMLWGLALSKSAELEESRPTFINVGILASLAPWLTLVLAFMAQSSFVLCLAVAINGGLFYLFKRTELKFLGEVYDAWFQEFRELLTRVVLACHFSVFVFALIY